MFRLLECYHLAKLVEYCSRCGNSRRGKEFVRFQLASIIENIASVIAIAVGRIHIYLRDRCCIFSALDWIYYIQVAYSNPTPNYRCLPLPPHDGRHLNAPQLFCGERKQWAISRAGNIKLLDILLLPLYRNAISFVSSWISRTLELLTNYRHWVPSV